MTKLVTAIHIERFGIYKIIEYDGPKMWEATIGDPYVKPDEILSQFPEPPSTGFKSALRQVLNTAGRGGQEVGLVAAKFKANCPVHKNANVCTHTDDADLDDVIIHLNDNCNWTREQIADWLDTLEHQPVFYPAEGVRNFNTTRMVTYKSPLSKDDAKEEA